MTTETGVAAERLVSIRAAGAALLTRDLKRMRRYPTTTLRILFFPAFFVVVVTGTFGAAARLPGFPARTLLDWVLPAGFVAAAVSAATVPGFAMSRDRESGFFDRLLLSPVSPFGLLVGPLSAALIRALIPFVLVVSLGFVAGVGLPGGILGLAAALVAAEGSALCAAAWGIGLSLRLGSVRKTVAPVQLVNFILLYVSTAQVPLTLMSGWLRFVARINPMSQVLTLARQGFLGPATWQQSWPGLVVLAVGGCLLTLFSFRGLQQVSQL